jgi:hypothetical protein
VFGREYAAAGQAAKLLEPRNKEHARLKYELLAFPYL